MKVFFKIIFFAHENMKKPASKVAKQAQIQPESQFLFHKNLPPQDFSIMTLIATCELVHGDKCHQSNRKSLSDLQRHPKMRMFCCVENIYASVSSTCLYSNVATQNNPKIYTRLSLISTECDISSLQSVLSVLNTYIGGDIL